MRDQHATELRDQHPTELRSENTPVENNSTEMQGINSRIKVRTKVNSPSGDRKKLVKQTISNLIQQEQPAAEIENLPDQELIQMLVPSQSPNFQVRSRLGSRQEKTNIVSLHLEPGLDLHGPSSIERRVKNPKRLKISNMYLNNFKG